MRRTIAALVAVLACDGAAHATAEDGACAVAAPLASTDVALPRVAGGR